MPTFKIGDDVVFSWCTGRENDYLIGLSATVLAIEKEDLYVLFENGEKHTFYADRFKFFEGDSNRLLRKVKIMWERQPYFQKIRVEKVKKGRKQHAHI